MSSTPPAGSDPQNGSEETQVSDGGSATAPPNAVQQQPDAPTIADLLLEIRETNKILRALVTQKALSTDTHPQPDSAVGDAPDGEDTDAAPPLSSPPVGLCATTDHAREARDSLWRKASQLTDEMIRAVFEMEPERAVALRDSFFETLHPEPNIQFHISLLTPEALKLSRGYMMAVPILLTPTTGVLWAGVPRFQGSYHSDASSNPVQWEGLPAEIQSALEKAWPLTFKVEWTIQSGGAVPHIGPPRTGPPRTRVAPPTTASTSPPPSSASTAPAPQPWPLGELRANFLCTPLISDPDGKLSPVFSVVDQPAQPKWAQSEMVRQASIWVFRSITHYGVTRTVDLRLIALISSCLGSAGIPHQHVRNTLLLDYFGRSRSLSFGNLVAWNKTLDGDTCLLKCTLRSFVPSFPPTKRVRHPHENRPGVPAEAHCTRSTGSLLAIGRGREDHFAEERKMIIGYLRTFLDSRLPTFSVIVLDDRWHSMPDTGERYINWEDQGFVVEGLNAGHHFLQCTLFAALHDWTDEWSQCLDWLDSVVRIELEDVMNHDESERLMFDSSFERSRIYFKTLQVLRIFSQAVKSTRRAVHDLAPDRMPKMFTVRTAMARPFIHPRSIATEDKTLMANWKILWSYYLESEKQLLQRIAEKTEEIKSLRDGLFNATSLREASRSTTMNRYVIVFTIVTVLYLPPSLIASVFGTELFTTEDTAETIGRFKTSTVVVSMTTYAFALFLIWLADRLEYPRIMLRKMKAWSAPLIRRTVEFLRLRKVFPDSFSNSSSSDSDIFSVSDSGSEEASKQGVWDQALVRFRRYLGALTPSRKREAG